MIESIVATSLVVVGVLGIMSLLISSSHQSISANDKLIAVYLAAEDVEIVKNAIDNYYVLAEPSGTNYFAQLPTGDFYIDYTSESFTENAPAQVYEMPDGSFVQSAAGNTATIFNRKVNIQYLSPSSVQVKATVWWNENGVPASTTIVDIFTGWRY